MLAVLPKACRTELNSTFPNLSALALFPRNAYFLPISANLSPNLMPSLLLLIQPFDFIFYEILPVLNIMMAVDSLFLLKTALLSTCLLSAHEAIFIKTSNLTRWRQKEFMYILKIALMMLSHLLFSSYSQLGFFL